MMESTPCVNLIASDRNMPNVNGIQLLNIAR